MRGATRRLVSPSSPPRNPAACLSSLFQTSGAAMYALPSLLRSPGTRPLLSSPPPISPGSAHSPTRRTNTDAAAAPAHRSTQPLLQRSRDKRIALPVRVVRRLSPPHLVVSLILHLVSTPRRVPRLTMHTRLTGTQSLLRQRAHFPLLAQLHVRPLLSSPSRWKSPSADPGDHPPAPALAASSSAVSPSGCSTLATASARSARACSRLSVRRRVSGGSLARALG